MWAPLRELVSGGTTLILTTQYLDEADRTADQIVVLDAGRAVATGTPAELKARVGGQRIAVWDHSRDPADCSPSAGVLEPRGGRTPTSSVRRRAR